MQQQTPPSWLSDIEDSTPLNNGLNGGAGISSNNNNSSNSSSSKGSIGATAALPGQSPMSMCTPAVVRHTLKAITMSLCVLMFSTACLGMQTINGVNKSGKIFVVAYMLFFSVLLFLFEAIQLHNIEWLDHMYQRNFGFLYSVVGKAFFVIFIAFLSFGLGDDSLSMATGLALSCFGAAKVALFLKYPEYFEDERASELRRGSEIMSNSSSL